MVLRKARGTLFRVDRRRKEALFLLRLRCAKEIRFQFAAAVIGASSPRRLRNRVDRRREEALFLSRLQGADQIEFQFTCLRLCEAQSRVDMKTEVSTVGR